MKRILWLVFYVLLSGNVLAQEDLTADLPFFQEQLPEYQNWLKTLGVDAYFTTDGVAVAEDKVKVSLKSQLSDDSLKVVWKELNRKYYEENRWRFGQKLFGQLVFLLDLKDPQLELLIFSQETNDTLVHVYFLEYLRVEEFFSNKMVSGIINIPLESVNLDAHTATERMEGAAYKAEEVARALGQFIRKYYESRQGGWWADPEIDVSNSYFCYFKYDITCIKNEILSDGYYEFIQFEVEVLKQDKEILVKYDIKGKYAPYILCPGKRNKFYKMMDDEAAMESYSRKMSKKIESFLKGYHP